jgi:hypothetical protein
MAIHPTQVVVAEVLAQEDLMAECPTHRGELTTPKYFTMSMLMQPDGTEAVVQLGLAALAIMPEKVQ